MVGGSLECMSYSSPLGEPCWAPCRVARGPLFGTPPLPPPPSPPRAVFPGLQNGLLMLNREDLFVQPWWWRMSRRSPGGWGWVSSRSSGWGWICAAVHFERGEDSSTVWPTAELRPLRKQLTVVTTSKDSACLL